MPFSPAAVASGPRPPADLAVSVTFSILHPWISISVVQDSVNLTESVLSLRQTDFHLLTRNSANTL